ncbi:MAG TPA: hypothetical protein ENN45_03380, partial [Bacteroidetes bacterium]|nr:hypothetical protein [Bacteroidota bacterium]
MIRTPFDKINEKLSKYLPSNLIEKIPEKWEKIGDVVIVKLSDDLTKYKELIGKVYADVLG